MTKQQFLGIIGANGSGKSTVCNYLESKGFTVLSLSSIVRNHVSEKGLAETRENLIKHANQLKESHGLDYFAKRCLEQVSNQNKVVFDSIRHPAEIALLKEKGVYLVGIIADIDNRFVRIQKRRAQTDDVSLETFKNQDEQERQGKSKGQAIDDALTLCDQLIKNDEGLPELYQKIDTLLQST